jgi:hypothetical protein
MARSPIRTRYVLALALAAAARMAHAQEASLETLLDLRAVRASGASSYLNGGLGNLRFDADHQGLELGRAQLVGKLRLGDVVTLNAAASTYLDRDRNPADLDDAWLEARPFPSGPVRWRFKLGAFHAPISLEHRAAGWNTVYTLTPSALNSWLGEELRTLGAEAEARWLGASSGYRGSVALIGALYGWNDPAGVIMAERGFALSDRPAMLDGGLGRPRVELFHEIDSRPGYYAGLDWQHHDRLEVRMLRYDNRADPGAHTSAGYAWRTWFSSAGVRYEPNARWTLIAQHLSGVTYVGPDAQPADQFEQVFRADFALASLARGEARITLRYDHFATRQLRAVYDYASDQRGHAWTVAALYALGARWSVGAELVRVMSSFPPRAERGVPVASTDSQLQLALRYNAIARY